MGESSKFPKFRTFKIPILKLAVCPLIFTISSLNGQLSLERLEINHRGYYDLSNSAFWGWLSVESQPQNPELRNYPENFHPWMFARLVHLITQPTRLPCTDANTVALKTFSNSQITNNFYLNQIHTDVLYLTFDIFFLLSEMVT